MSLLPNDSIVPPKLTFHSTLNCYNLLIYNNFCDYFNGALHWWNNVCLYICIYEFKVHKHTVIVC